MKLKLILQYICIVIFSLSAKMLCGQQLEERKLWVEQMLKIAQPVLEHLNNKTLVEKMPVFGSNGDSQYCTAFGRVVCGVAPWLELGADSTAEGRLREQTLALTIGAITIAFSPESEDYMHFSNVDKSIVDIAFFAQGLLQAPNQLWGKLDEQTRTRIMRVFISTRKVQLPENNFLLFASVIEAAILNFGGQVNKARLLYGINRFMEDFYLGDGIYGDGPTFTSNYYSSFVIHPLLTQSIRVAVKHGLYKKSDYMIQVRRLKRFSEIQERTIASNGEFPLIGRTLICRMGAFYGLSQACLMGHLSEKLAPGQVRSALTAVLRTSLADESNFAANGFLNVGFAGKQEGFAEKYVSSGSAYHCMTVFAVLGIKPSDPFWTEPFTEWTSLKAYQGKDFPPDHALHDMGAKELIIKSVHDVYYALGKWYIALVLSVVLALLLLAGYIGYRLGGLRRNHGYITKKDADPLTETGIRSDVHYRQAKN